MTLNIDQLVRDARLAVRSGASGTLNWSAASGQVAGMDFEAGLDSENSWLQLDFVVFDSVSGAGRAVRQRISLTDTRPRYGGRRWWFVCPVTGKRVRRLHLPSGADHFASRLAHGLTYECQVENVYDRAARRARKLMARLGVDPMEPVFFIKPKGMRCATYLRYVDRIKRLKHVSDRRWPRLGVRLVP